MTVPPGGAVDYPCVLTVYRPGRIDDEITLFLEDNGIREVTLTVRGVGVAPEGKPDDPPPAP